MVEDYYGFEKFWKENVSGTCTFPDALEEERDIIANKMIWACIRAEYSFKCLYKGEKPLSRKDYARVRKTHKSLDHKVDLLINCKTETAGKQFEEFVRKFCLPPNAYRGGKL